MELSYSDTFAETSCFVNLSAYSVLQKYAHIGLKQNLLRSTTLDIITRLLDNAAFVCIHVAGRLSKNFSEVCGLRSQQYCARNYEKKRKFHNRNLPCPVNLLYCLNVIGFNSSQVFIIFKDGV